MVVYYYFILFYYNFIYFYYSDSETKFQKLRYSDSETKTRKLTDTRHADSETETIHRELETGSRILKPGEAQEQGVGNAKLVMKGDWITIVQHAAFESEYSFAVTSPM